MPPNANPAVWILIRVVVLLLQLLQQQLLLTFRVKPDCDIQPDTSYKLQPNINSSDEMG